MSDVISRAAAVAAINGLASLPATGSSAPAPPKGPFTQFASMQWDYDVAHPKTISGVQVTTADEDAFGIQGYYPAGGGRPAPSPSAFTITDIIAVCTTPYDPGGTKGAGIWFGTWVNAARIVGQGPNEGIWTGSNSLGSTIVDFVAHSPHVGLYVEHVTRGVKFQRFDIAGMDSNSVNVEWWYKGEGSSGLTFDTGRVYCPPGQTGIFLDAGTFGCTIRNVTFYGPGDAIGLPANLAGPTPNSIDTASCVFLNGGRQVYTHNNPIG